MLGDVHLLYQVLSLNLLPCYDNQTNVQLDKNPIEAH